MVGGAKASVENGPGSTSNTPHHRDDRRDVLAPCEEGRKSTRSSPRRPSSCSGQLEKRPSAGRFEADIVKVKKGQSHLLHHSGRPGSHRFTRPGGARRARARIDQDRRQLPPRHHDVEFESLELAQTEIYYSGVFNFPIRIVPATYMTPRCTLSPARPMRVRSSGADLDAKNRWPEHGSAP